MKRTELNKLGLEKQTIDKILYLHQRDTEAHKKVLVKKEKEIIEVKDNLCIANDKINTLSKIVKQFENIDIEELMQRAINIEKKYIIKELFNNQIFTSKLAKRAAIEEFLKQEPEFKDGHFLGVEEFFINLRKEDPDAFRDKSTSIITTGVVCR